MQENPLILQGSNPGNAQSHYVLKTIPELKLSKNTSNKAPVTPSPTAISGKFSLTLDAGSVWHACAEKFCTLCKKVGEISLW